MLTAHGNAFAYLVKGEQFIVGPAQPAEYRIPEAFPICFGKVFLGLIGETFTWGNESGAGM